MKKLAYNLHPSLFDSKAHFLTTGSKVVQTRCGRDGGVHGLTTPSWHTDPCYFELCSLPWSSR